VAGTSARPAPIKLQAVPFQGSHWRAAMPPPPRFSLGAFRRENAGTMLTNRNQGRAGQELDYSGRSKG